jgi:cellulose synthase/poly-beta-1,6-N-acetylglucosamine synthase-like glycosyltransferase
VRQGSAPYVLFTDGDCTPDPHWVERMAMEFDRGADVVAGRTVATPQGPIAETQLGRNLHKYFVEYMSRPTIGQDSQGVSCLFPTCNVAYRRRVLEALGEFPVEIAADLAFSQRAVRQGFLCRICEQARVGHISETTSTGIAHKLFLYSVQFRVLLPQWLAALFLILILPLVALVYFLFIYAYRIAKAQGIGIPLSHFALFETLHLTMILCRICSKPFTVQRRVY